MGKRDIPYSSQLRAAGHHLEEGGQLASVARVTRDCAPRCENPQRVVTEGRPWAVGPTRRRAIGPGKVLILDLTVPCRKCARCLEARAKEWTRRAIEETITRPRTWFGTLTLDPYHHAMSMVAVKSRTPDWAALRPAAQFGLLVSETGKEITRWLKRVRKRSGARIRYLLVAEQHSERLAGLPHFHILIHEVDAGRPVRKEVLKSEWKLGFTRWKLADRWTARYVCKYLAKDASTRVRASKDYGRGDDRSVVELLRGRDGSKSHPVNGDEKSTNDPLNLFSD